MSANVNSFYYMTINQANSNNIDSEKCLYSFPLSSKIECMTPHTIFHIDLT